MPDTYLRHAMDVALEMSERVLVRMRQLGLARAGERIRGGLVGGGELPEAEPAGQATGATAIEGAEDRDELAEPWLRQSPDLVVRTAAALALGKEALERRAAEKERQKQERELKMETARNTAVANAGGGGGSEDCDVLFS